MGGRPSLCTASRATRDLDGMAGVGLCYRTGRGIPADPKQAAVWFRKVLKQAGADKDETYIDWAKGQLRAVDEK